MTAPVADYNSLSTPDLIKLINTEYDMVLAGDRNAFQKAIPLGQMLISLKPRAGHGSWKDWVAANCPKLSYETVALYMRLAAPDNLTKLLAASKCVSVTDLKMTITEARGILAKPKGSGGTKRSKKSQNKQPDEAGNQASTTATAPEEIVKALAPDELFDILKAHYDDEQLGKLSRLLSLHLHRPAPDSLDIPSDLRRNPPPATMQRV
jgi:hypothetical protein